MLCFRFALRRLIALTLCWAALAHGNSSSQAAVTKIEILETLPYAEGKAFGAIGPYERLLGRVHFAVDPKAEANARVIDLKLAPQNAAGLVEFSADVEILAPVDRTKASGTLFYDVNNRGHRLALKVFNEEADDFLMRQGIVVVWSGWIAEVLPMRDDNVEHGNLLRLDAPIAKQAGQTITGLVRTEVVSETAEKKVNLTGRVQLGSYQPTAAGLEKATLTRRVKEKDPREVMPREQWTLEITPSAAAGQKYCLPKVELAVEGGIQPGVIYELIYEAQDPVVQGLGLTSIRDLISFLKYNATAGNPLAIENKSVTPHAIGFGVSQSGRLLRVMLHEGFNEDEQERIVFDGMIPHVAGAGLGFFNHRFAMPSAFNGQHNMHLFPCDIFPFTYETTADVIICQKDGILERARRAKVVPKIMHIQNSAEYWHRAGSLVHTTPRFDKDVEIPDEVRFYSVAGAQHSWGNDLTARPPFYGTLTNNPTDYRPHLRAMLMAMIAWVKEDKLPPPSVYPKFADGTLVPWQAPKSGWHPLPGVRYPTVIQEPELAYFDFGPGFMKAGIITIHPPQPEPKHKFSVYVPAVDDDNNDLGMVKLPFLRVPIATYTGWNLRDAKIGAEGELLMLKGGYIPFARTKAERLAAGDPRLSLEERYGTAEVYLAKVEQAIGQLVKERHLLAEDAPRLLARAQKLAEVFPAAKAETK